MGDELPVNYKLSGLVRQHADVRPMVWENDRKLIVLIVLGAVMQDGEAPVVLIVHLVRKVRTCTCMHAGEVANVVQQEGVDHSVVQLEAVHAELLGSELEARHALGARSVVATSEGAKAVGGRLRGRRTLRRKGGVGTRDGGAGKK